MNSELKEQVPPLLFSFFHNGAIPDFNYSIRQSRDIRIVRGKNHRAAAVSAHIKQEFDQAFARWNGFNIHIFIEFLISHKCSSPFCLNP